MFYGLVFRGEELADETGEGAAAYLAHLGDLVLRHTPSEQRLYLFLLREKRVLLEGGLSALGATQRDSLLALACQRLFGALRDEVTLYLRRQAEGKRQHFALYVVSEAVVVLYRPHLTVLAHAVVEYLHNHKQVAPEPREFGTDDDVVLLHLSEQSPQRTLVVVPCAADSFFYPAVDWQVLFVCKTLNFKALVLYRLLVGRDTNISIYHRLCIYCLFYWVRLEVGLWEGWQGR